MTVYFKPSIASNNTIVQKVANSMKIQILRDYVLSYDILQCGSTIEPRGDTGMVETHNLIFQQPPKAVWSQFVSRIKLDKQKLIADGIRISNVRSSARALLQDKIQVIASEDNDEEWILRLRIQRLDSVAKIDTTSVSEDERLVLDKVASTDSTEIFLDSLQISGVKGITETYIARQGEEFVVETDGSSLADILASGDAVDCSRCTSNHIHEIMSVLGIEATQNMIYREASDVLGDSGEYVSARHLMLLAAKMCHYGQPVPVTRHGMKRSKAGVLVSASFERTVETFVQAAIHGQTDNCGGVTEVSLFRVFNIAVLSRLSPTHLI